MKTYENISFKKVEGHDLYMDIYMPDAENPPLIMWIHGGGWKALNKNWILVRPMLERGYAIASVEYRYADEAEFPAQMYDLKDALLYLKTNAKEYGYDPTKVIVSGDSAGGHLAAMIGVSAGNKDWELTDGDYSIQAAVIFCGPTCMSLDIKNLGPESDGNPFNELIGAPLRSKAGVGRAAMASPVTYVNGTEPPFLLLHGSHDPTVSLFHPRNFRNALEAAGDAVHMYMVPGGVHGLASHIVDDIICEFLDFYIKGITTVIAPDLMPEHDRTIPEVKK